MMALGGRCGTSASGKPPAMPLDKRTAKMMKLVLLCALVAFSAAEGLKTVTIDGGEQIITLSTGSSGCAQAKAGDKLTMHYTGTIDPNSATGVKGSKFDSSLVPPLIPP
jgi:hypothetical protein